MLEISVISYGMIFVECSYGMTEMTEMTEVYSRVLLCWDDRK
jgi:hypothetical protein